MDDLHKQYLRALSALPIETCERIKALEGESLKDHAKIVLLEYQDNPKEMNKRITNWLNIIS